MSKFFLIILSIVIITGCSSPNFRMQMGLFRSIPAEVSEPMITLSSLSSIPLTPDQIQAIMQSLIIPENRTDILYFEIGTKSQSVIHVGEDPPIEEIIEEVQ